MKTLRFLLFGLFSLFFSLVNIQCESDDNSYILSDVSAPTDVDATFDISQDDTGTVSLTPSATGVTNFNVYYGDTENEEPTAIAPGETGTHVYAEGEYTVRIVAVGLTGLTSEYVQNIRVSFRAPEGLTFEVVNSGLNASVIPSATNATLYDVYFGENEDEEPISIMTGETAEYQYTAAGSYIVRVVARGAGAATVESSQIVMISGASDPITLPITFDLATVNYEFVTFNGAGFEVVDNPELSGANTTASQVGAITNSGNMFEGGTFTLGTPVDFNGDNKTITMKVYSEQSLPVLIKFEAGVNGARQTEVVAEHGGTGWEELIFDFAADAVKSYIDGNQGTGEPFVPTGQYAGITLFIDGPGTTAGTFYIDDLAQSSGAAPVFPQFPVDFESSDLDYTLIGFGGPDFGEIPAAVIENPDKSGINTSNNVAEINKVSGAQTYGGANFNLSGAADFSEGTTVTMKVWSPRVGTPILFKMEDTSSPPNNDGNPTVFVEVITNSTVAMQWEELTFDLTSFDAFDTSNAYDRVILFPDFGNAGNGESFYFDDLRLGSGDDGDGDGGGNEATAPSEAAPAPTLAAENVISMFSNAYDNVPVDTWRTDWSNPITMLEDVTVAGNDTKKYSALDFVGVETLNSPIDASAMTHFHTDVWSADFTQFSIKLVDLGPDGTIGTPDDVEHQVDFTAPAQGEWVSYDIPLSDFEGLTSTAQIGQLIYVGRPVGENTLYVDNVYFHD